MRKIIQSIQYLFAGVAVIGLCNLFIQAARADTFFVDVPDSSRIEIYWTQANVEEVLQSAAEKINVVVRCDPSFAKTVIKDGKAVAESPAALLENLLATADYSVTHEKGEQVVTVRKIRDLDKIAAKIEDEDDALREFGFGPQSNMKTATKQGGKPQIPVDYNGTAASRSIDALQNQRAVQQNAVFLHYATAAEKK